MPNYVQNKLTIHCNDVNKIKEIFDAVKGDNGFDFETIVPMPVDIFMGNIGDNERKKYGKNNWYDWSIDNWGTKWNSSDVYTDPSSHEISFQTAWSAPHPVIEALSKMYPEAEIHHEWADEDLGNNCGMRDYFNGKVDSEYIPDGEDEALDFALSVWEYEPEEIGLKKDENGHYVTIDEEEDKESEQEE